MQSTSGGRRREPAPLPSDPEPPALTLEVVEYDGALGEAVDAFIHGNVEARERLREIADLQETLRHGVDPDVWRLVLRIEERANRKS